MNKMILIAVAAATVSFQASATISASGSVGGAPSGVTLDNLDTLPLGSGGGTTATGLVVSFTPDAQAVQGGLAGVYAPPFLSGGNGAGFGNANGPDATTYLAAGATSSFAGAQASVLFPALEKYVGLLWGSVDTFNTLNFFNGTTLVGTLTGADVIASPNGNQGVNGTVYVNVNSTLAFDHIVATSAQHTFEFDNIAYNINTVPETGTLGVLAGGLGLLGLSLRRRAK